MPKGRQFGISLLVMLLLLCSTIYLGWAQNSHSQRNGRVDSESARQGNQNLLNSGRSKGKGTVSRVRGIKHHPDRSHRPRTPPIKPIYRSIDGSGNNVSDPEMGASFTPLQRWTSSDYADGVSAMAGPDRPSARAVSNAVNAQDTSIPNPMRASDFLWQWGQFLDHDVDLTDAHDPAEPADIAVPVDDPFFDPDGDGTAVIGFNRSLYHAKTGTDPNNPREQLNEITGWIDASNVYGSEPERANALRTNDGTGRLRTSDGNLLPFNTEGFSNAGGSSASLFLAGDVRANEQVGLTAMHTLFMREHNRLARSIRQHNPGLSGDQIYERARKRVGALMQVITYQEFIPALLGPEALSPYERYDPTVNARISNLFSAAAYRFGHSGLNASLLRLDTQGREVSNGHVVLREAFFAPTRITDEGGIAPLLRGLANQVMQTIDPYVIDDVRNFLFGNPGSDGFDLASLNIQRGRDHGLPSYNEARIGLGLAPVTSFSDVSSNPELQERLAAVYASIEDIDIWVGGLAEDPMPGALVGELFYTVLKRQFEALRDGDRFWYIRTFNANNIDKIENTRLSDIIRRNTEIGQELQDDVFHVPARVLGPSRNHRR